MTNTQTETRAETLTIEQLQAALATATGDGGSWGHNMHPSKAVRIRVGGHTYPLEEVAVSFDGSFFLALDGPDQAHSDPTAAIVAKLRALAEEWEGEATARGHRVYRSRRRSGEYYAAEIRSLIAELEGKA